MVLLSHNISRISNVRLQARVATPPPPFAPMFERTLSPFGCLYKMIKWPLECLSSEAIYRVCIKLVGLLIKSALLCQYGCQSTVVLYMKEFSRKRNDSRRFSGIWTCHSRKSTGVNNKSLLMAASRAPGSWYYWLCMLALHTVTAHCDTWIEWSHRYCY